MCSDRHGTTPPLGSQCVVGSQADAVPAGHAHEATALTVDGDLTTSTRGGKLLVTNDDCSA